MLRKIPFNEPYHAGNELNYIQEAISRKHISGDGFFTQKCHSFFRDRFRFQKVLLTTSCTSALEMSALLMGLEPGDEVIMSSFTFTSTATAFILRGAKILFADSGIENPNIDVHLIESLISKKTKAIVPVHYAGIACDMHEIMRLAKNYSLFVIEDAAQAVDSYYYKETPLGGIGHFGAFSFHETKNISSGEGGMLAINEPKFFERAEVIREKGTNRSAFFRGEIDKYGWIDIGSSFLPSEITAAFLYAQLEKLDEIQCKRRAIWHRYWERLKPLEDSGFISLPKIPHYATNNAHIFYILCRSFDERQLLISYLKENEIHAIFHYLPLHSSKFYRDKHDGRSLPNCDRYSNCLLRLPFYVSMFLEDVDRVSELITKFYRQANKKRCF